MDKVVVIGGSGFLGSHTADELSRRGFSVTIFDQSVSPWLRDDQKMVEGNILDREAVSSVVEGARYVYHFGGIADIGEAAERPFDTVNVNVMGTSTILEAVVKAGVERFVYASTMYVYSPYGSFYRASKQAAETVIEAYHDKFDLNYTFLRYGSLYGPRAQNWNGLHRYVREIVESGTLNYGGTGKERREYIHVRDAARLSVDVLDEVHKNQAITVTGSQILTASELIEMIAEISGQKVDANFVSESGRSDDHYAMTPYRYTPKPSKKLVPGEFIDIGQGILDLVEEIHQQLQGEGLE